MDSDALVLTDVADGGVHSELSSRGRVISFVEPTGENSFSAEYVFDLPYVTEGPLVDDDDFDRMRAWLAELDSYEGIDLGLLLHSDFIQLFGHELFRQFRLVSQILEEEEPHAVTVVTEGRAAYEFLEYGGDRLEPSIVEAVCGAESVPFVVETRSSIPGLKDRLFERVGASGLLSVERLTEIGTRVVDRDGSSGSRILFFLGNVHNSSRVRPVLSKLEEFGHDPLVIVQSHGFLNFDPGGLDEFRDLARVRSFESYQDSDVYGTARDERSRLADSWSAIRRDEAFTSRFTIDDRPAWRALEDRFRLYYDLQFPRMVKYVETCRRILQTERPEIVVLKGDGPPPTRTFTRVAKDYDVPSLLIQHGRTVDSRMFIPITDHVAVWGERSADLFERQGFGETDLTITGAPHLDVLADHRVDRSAFVRSLGIDETDRVVILASQPFREADRVTLVESVVRQIAPMDGVSLILRPHPREDRTLHRRMAEEAGSSVVLPPDTALFDTLAASDLLIGCSSTVLLEASLLDTPVLAITYLENQPDAFYTDHMETVDRESNLPEVVERLLFDEKYRTDRLSEQPRLGREFMHNEDGRANERIVDLIEELMEHGERYPRRISFDGPLGP